MAFPSPIGISDFEALRSEGLHYVDKSNLLVGLIGRGSKVVLFPRPRRFGKSLAQSMMRYFFEISDKDRSRLFEDLHVWQCEPCREHFQKHPVIDLSFKNIKPNSWDQMAEAVALTIGAEFDRHRYLLQSGHLTTNDISTFKQIAQGKASLVRLQRSMTDLSLWLERHHGAKPVILLDEYDVPIQASWTGGFYEKAMDFFRDFIAATFKDNEHLYRGVLTGILRVSKESMFSGANNVDVYSILDPDYATCFGFTQEEVDEIMEQVGVPEAKQLARAWYNGYRFAGNTIYNPWSVLNYAAKVHAGPKPYWIFTGADNVLRKLVLDRGSDVTEAFKRLMDGGAVKKRVTDYLVLEELETKQDAVWNLLLLSGYLTMRDETTIRGRRFAGLVIPNHEVQLLFEESIVNWTEEKVPAGSKGLSILLDAVFRGDETLFGKLLGELVARSFSYHDMGGKEPERVYQAFVLGLVVHLQDYFYVRSNRESGYGRYDVALIPKPSSERVIADDDLEDYTLLRKRWIGSGVVFELKSVDAGSEEAMDAALDDAMEQIERLDYDADLREAGASPVIKWGVVFDGKRVWVRCQKSDS